MFESVPESTLKLLRMPISFNNQRLLVPALSQREAEQLGLALFENGLAVE